MSKDSKDFLSTAKEGTLLNLRVSPGAKRTSVEGHYGEGAIRLKFAAPPVDGKANAEVSVSLPSCSGSHAPTPP